MRVKYILHPGVVISTVDGREHYIDSYQLALLHKVKFDECVIAHQEEARLIDKTMKSIIHLYPNPDGIY